MLSFDVTISTFESLALILAYSQNIIIIFIIHMVVLFKDILNNGIFWQCWLCCHLLQSLRLSKVCGDCILLVEILYFLRGTANFVDVICVNL